MDRLRRVDVVLVVVPQLNDRIDMIENLCQLPCGGGGRMVCNISQHVRGRKLTLLINWFVEPIPFDRRHESPSIPNIPLHHDTKVHLSSTQHIWHSLKTRILGVGNVRT